MPGSYIGKKRNQYYEEYGYDPQELENDLENWDYEDRNRDLDED